MKPRTKRIIAVAYVLSFVLIVVLVPLFLLDKTQYPWGQLKPGFVHVWIAKQDIDPGVKITKEMAELVVVPKEQAEQFKVFTNWEDIKGKYARYNIERHQFFSDRFLAEAVGLSQDIPESEHVHLRAKVFEFTGSQKTIEQLKHRPAIDVLLTLQDNSSPDKSYVNYVILRQSRLLAVDPQSNAATKDGKPPRIKRAALLCTAEESVLLTHANLMGPLLLRLSDSSNGKNGNREYRASQSKPELITVWKAKQHIQPGVKISQEMVRKSETTTEHSVAVRALNRWEDIVGKYARFPMTKGQIVGEQSLRQKPDSIKNPAINDSENSTTRQFTMEIDCPGLIGKFMVNEPWVDVVQTSCHQSPKGWSRKSRIALQRLKVVAIGSPANGSSKVSQAQRTRAVTLACTPKQAATLANLYRTGPLSLLYRRYDDDRRLNPNVLEVTDHDIFSATKIREKAENSRENTQEKVDTKPRSMNIMIANNDLPPDSIGPGSLVDVILLSPKKNQNGNIRSSKIVVQRVKILQVQSTNISDDFGKIEGPFKIVKVLCNAKQAALLAHAHLVGPLSLRVRSQEDQPEDKRNELEKPYSTPMPFDEATRESGWSTPLRKGWADLTKRLKTFLDNQTNKP